MNEILAFLLVAVCYASAAEESCANFGPWRDWTDTCLWLPMSEMREKMMAACGMSASMPVSDLPSMPELENLPTAPCGHCSMKARCRTRLPKDMCFPMEMEKQTCHEHGDVCTFPKISANNLGCGYNLIKPYFSQCAGRPELPDWEMQGYRKLGQMWNDMNCIEKDGQCKCCCHPYKPSPDGSTCQEQTPPQCEEFGDYNDWSTCLWLPLKTVEEYVSEHCALGTMTAKKNFLSKFKLPGSVQVPEQPCGYCSSQIKCRKRPAEDSDGRKRCFPVEGKKKACGQSDECPTCADICTMPKVLDSCNYSENFRNMAMPKIKAVLKKLPYSMTHGLTQMLGLMPISECVEKDGQCKCCCHPYKPNADGTGCELNPICKTSREHAVEIDWNASEKDDDNAFWFL